MKLVVSTFGLLAAHAAAAQPMGFPKDFIWGSATAAYQCEGAYTADNRGLSIWDTFSHIPGKTYNNDTGDVADDQYHRYNEDISMMSDVGFDFYRLSISPTRILPNGTLPANPLGIKHYHKVFDALIAKGIQPFVTLYHWDYPQALQEKYGGWLDNQSVVDFTTYAEICFQEYGDKVKYWLTFNEPWTFTFQGFGLGVHAPGRCSDRRYCEEGNSLEEPYIATHNVLKAHAKTVALYRKKYQNTQGGKIGITLNTDWAEPFSNSSENKAAAERNMMFQFGWFASPIFFGYYPEVMVQRVGSRLPKFTEAESKELKGSLDFLGLNHYGSHYAMKKTTPLPTLPGPPPNTQGWTDDVDVDQTFFRNGKPIGREGASDWLYATPWGFLKLLRWINAKYSPKAIIVTENGYDVPGENKKSLAHALNDTAKVWYYQSYIGAMRQAVGEGVPVKGYTAWSFLDNYEWADGYSKRFGLVYVDYKHNLTRHLKQSGQWFNSFLRGNEPTPFPKFPADVATNPVPPRPKAEAKKPKRKHTYTYSPRSSANPGLYDKGSSSWLFYLLALTGVATVLATGGACFVHCRRKGYATISKGAPAPKKEGKEENSKGYQDEDAGVYQEEGTAEGYHRHGE
ncbi:hypothetical protein AAMO2058_000788900 [Amorphochlora amoebiformis]|uniref:Beta-glucosidase n=1 Tax=Amorphochlora amoebiformis TaxID=1561963 RepID=A0A7S0GTY4_9EUKA|mmetsp:Transcript_15378/g.24337  ORF Transcript_15378/g.24337 Transcript_15378/m.24337 type:complete len:625 (+) Transcript_15378:75-1949(+)